MLSDSESESESHDIQLTINEHYAKAYAAKKEREELSKLEEKYGSDAEDDDSEEDSEDAESEDEDGEELTPAVDAAILRTLAKIKRKDPDIYEKDKSIFNEEHERSGRRTLRPKPNATENTKPLTMKQHALSSLLHATSRSPSPEPQFLTHDQEQSQLRSEIITAFHGAVGDDGDNDADDGLLVLREKTKDEVEREEEEYQEFLKREVGEDIKDLVTVEDNPVQIGAKDSEEAEEVPSKGKKKRRTNKKGKEKEKAETDQEFLMSYILNRGWLDRSAKRVPTFDEVTHHKESEGNPDDKAPLDAEHESSIGEEDDFEDILDRFESSYNFRFEEPDAAVIPTHPRNIPSVVRRQDTTRKDARERRKQRKNEELTKKKEDVRRMKALKMKELHQKLDQIGREGGVEIDSEALVNFDLDGDWDPEKHDRQMAGLYEGEDSGDVEKPQWTEDINIDNILSTSAVDRSESKKKKKRNKQKPNEAVADGVDVDAMDADISRAPDAEEWDGTEEMRKRKVQEYMDEVYGMEFNDMVGDIPTRFKYTPVTAKSYSLTPQEILLATDGELNQYMGIKRIAPYRKDGRWDMRRAQHLNDLKAKLKDRSWKAGQINTDEVESRKLKKRKGKKERQRAKGVDEPDDAKEMDEDGKAEHSSLSMTRAKKRRKE